MSVQDSDPSHPVAVSLNKLIIDGQEYVIATWPDADGGGATPAIAELAEELGGELLA